MGNFISMHASKVWRRSKFKRKHQDFKDTNGETDHDHQGIRTVGVNNRCHFSTISDLCICIITWNMNGQVSYEDLVELVGRNRKFDLLVIGLQEVPREEISKMLQEALGKTHIGKVTALLALTVGLLLFPNSHVYSLLISLILVSYQLLSIISGY